MRWKIVLPLILFAASPALAQAPPATGLGEKRTLNQINHVVKPGESLFGLAERYYGNGYEWHRLKAANPWVNPDRLVVGEVISVPDPSASPGSGSSLRGRSSSNPGPLESNNPGFSQIFVDFGKASLFGYSLYKILLLLCVWFVMHAAIQGSFVWFAAHLAFVKDVTFKKAMRSTVQSEGLATVFVFVISITALMMVYVGTSPPGKPALPELMGTVEEYLRSDAGMALAGFFVVGLYVFLGVRFIPQAFEIPGGQGVAIVFLAVLIPHVIFLYLLGSRWGFIG